MSYPYYGYQQPQYYQPPMADQLSQLRQQQYIPQQMPQAQPQQAQAGGVGDGQREDDGAGLFVGVVHDAFHDGVLLRSAADDEHQLFFVHEVDAHEPGRALHAGAFGVDDGAAAGSCRAASMIEPV